MYLLKLIFIYLLGFLLGYVVANEKVLENSTQPQLTTVSKGIEEVEPRCLGLHEVYLQCASSCPGDRCSNVLKHADACLPKKKGKGCKPACMCRPGFYRNDRGRCVQYKQCPLTERKACGENEYLDRCPRGHCEADLCPKSNVTSLESSDCPVPAKCGIPKCMCEANFRRDRHSRKCVSLKHCLMVLTTTTTASPMIADLGVINVFDRGVSKFSSNFFRQLMKVNPGKSVVCSGLSVEIPLAEIMIGSSGETHTELSNALGIPDNDMIRAIFPQQILQLNNIKNVTLNFANALFAPRNLVFKAQFKKDLIKIFDSELKSVDFTDPSLAAGTINTWVESNTKGYIKNLISHDALNALTRLVIVNAIYFKGAWKTQFDTALTKEQDFYYSYGQTRKIPMMYQENFVKYGSNENFQIIELPYSGDQLSMFILLPHEISGLKEAVDKMRNQTVYEDTMNRMSKVKVQISIPKFKIETTIQLKGILAKIGIRRIFDEKDANLDRMLVDDEYLHVTTAVQKAFIEVNEEGTTAAAATGLVASTRSISLPIVRTFIANRPFAIYLKFQNVDVFTGCYYGI